MQGEDEACNQEKKTGEKLIKNAFRLQLSEFFNTRAMKSSPDFFKVFADLAGHDQVADAGRATTCRRKSTKAQLF